MKSIRKSRGCLKLFGEYRALLIKMMLLTKRKRAQTLAEFILAYLLLGLLLCMRYLLSQVYYPALEIPAFRPFDTMLSNSTLANTTYYYPS